MHQSSWIGLTLAAAIFAAPAVSDAAPGSIVFGAPQQQTVYGETGYSSVLKGGLALPANERFSWGPELILDIGAFYSLGTGVPGTFTLAGAVPLRFVISETSDVIVGLRASPGIGVSFPRFGGDALFDILLHAALNVGYKATDELIVGGGVDLPVTIAIGSASGALIPILFGPAVEYALTPELSLTSELKMGPHIFAGDVIGSGVTFGFKFAIGIAYSF